MQLEKLTGLRGFSKCFLKEIDRSSEKEREELRTELMVGLMQCKANMQRMKEDIELETDKIRELQEQVKAQNSQWEKERAKMRDEIDKRQQKHNAETERLRQEVYRKRGRCIVL